MRKQSFSEKLGTASANMREAGAILSAHVEGGDGDMPRSLPDGIEYLSGAVDDYLAEQEPQRYSHRNGETVPPTEAGWYWARQRTRRHNYNVHAMTFVTSKRWGKTMFVLASDMSMVPVAEIIAQWWGPVSPPWKSNA